MTSRFDVLTQQLFQKNIADCTVDELEELAKTHPYFAPAQYALLLKLKETNVDSYEKQYQKTILFYHDPLAFDQFINEHLYQVNDSSFEVKEMAVAAETQTESILPPVPKVYQNPEEKEEVIIENTDQQSVISSPPDEIIESREEKPVAETAQEINNEVSQEEGIGFKEEEPIETTTETPALSNETGKPEITKEPVTNDNSLVFEPYHTVDYFASQGIKLSQEEVPKDKFGKQLKSFTEWLKTMKKHPAKEQAKPLDAIAEQKVETLAAHSVEGEDIYTETMAEVWIQQGNREKAIEIYNKLSLQNPSKRAYFAAKINSLN
jgi:hypothetical protein